MFAVTLTTAIQYFHCTLWLMNNELLSGYEFCKRIINSEDHVSPVTIDTDLKNNDFLLLFFITLCLTMLHHYTKLVAKRLNGSEHFSLDKAWTDRQTGQQMDMVNPVYPFPLPSCYDDNSRVCNIC